MKQTIHLADRPESDDTLLHVPDGKHGEIIRGAMDEIERLFRSTNGVGPEDERLICGGCLAGVIVNVMVEAFRRGYATTGDAYGWARLVEKEAREKARAAKLASISNGPEARLFDDHGEPIKLKTPTATQRVQAMLAIEEDEDEKEDA